MTDTVTNSACWTEMEKNNLQASALKAGFQNVKLVCDTQAVQYEYMQKNKTKDKSLLFIVFGSGYLSLMHLCDTKPTKIIGRQIGGCRIVHEIMRLVYKKLFPGGLLHSCTHCNRIRH